MGSKILSPDDFLPMPGDPPVPWPAWYTTVEDFFFLMDRVATENQKLDDKTKNLYLCQFLGVEGRRVASAYPFYLKRGTLKHYEFVKELKVLFLPKVNQVRAAFDFRTRMQHSDETVTAYVTELRKLISLRAYGDGTLENKLLAEQLVISCCSKSTQQKLLAEVDVNFDIFVNIMLNDEAANKNSAAIQQAKVTDVVVAQTSSTFNKQHTTQGKPKVIRRNIVCYGCGKNDHVIRSDKCPAKGKICKACGKKDHFSSVCNSKKNQHKVKSLKVRNLKSDSSRLQVKVTLLSTMTKNWNYKAFVDTGSDISTITESIFQAAKLKFPLMPSNTSIRNFDGSRVTKILGKVKTQIRIADKSTETELYVTTNDLSPTIGMDVIRALELTIQGRDLRVAALNEDVSYISKFPSLTSEKMGTFRLFQHEIAMKPDAIPTSTKLRSIPYARREQAIVECKKMVEDGIWSPVEKSEWIHGLVTVPKNDGSVRLTTDLISLNKYVIPERHPIPNTTDIFLQLRGANYFSKLDLRKGYFHIQLHENSRLLTTTITPAGLFAYNRLPMGLTDSASVFQRAVEKTLSDCKNVQTYIDDIIVYGKTKKEHDRYLHDVLKALDENDFRLNIQKCEFCKNSIKYLGHIISSNGIQADPKNVKPILEATSPKTLKQVQSFLGAVNYYSNFIGGLAEKAEPLRALTRKGNKFQWTDTEGNAFKILKEAISNNVKLSIFDLTAETIVTTDASDIGIGAVLTQIQYGQEVTIAYASHTLSSAERNYSVGEKEALACIWACEHWSSFLLGRTFILRSDHSALQTLLSKHTSTKKSAKFLRWLERLSAFDYTVEYKKGTDNVVADFLSRAPIRNENFTPFEHFDIKQVITTNISLHALRSCQKQDDTCQNLFKFIKYGWPSRSKIAKDFSRYYFLREEFSVDNGLITRGDRILVPELMRKKILVSAHEGHPGIVRMKRQLRKSFWWPGQDRKKKDL